MLEKYEAVPSYDVKVLHSMRGNKGYVHDIAIGYYTRRIS